MNVLATVSMWFWCAYKALELAFTQVFPEFAFLGVWVVLFCLILFLYYLVKSGIGQALKISIFMLVVLLFLIYSTHVVYRLVAF